MVLLSGRALKSLIIPSFFLLLSSPFATQALEEINDPQSVPVIFELTKPEYEGRGVGTAGLTKAVNYLTERIKDLELKAPFADDSFTQEFSVFEGNELGAENSFNGSTIDQFVPLSFSLSGKVESARLVFAGFGITLKENGRIVYDDYRGINVRDKIVIVMTGDPAIGNADSVFKDPKHYHLSTVIYKVQNAFQKGAKGIVLVQNPLALGESPERSLEFNGRAGGGAVFDLLAGRASIDFINESILGTTKLKAIQEKIARTQKPNSFLLSKRATMAVSLIRKVGKTNNVAAVIPGKDASLQDEYIVVGAHLDHIGFGGESSRDPNGIGKLHPGADDNASGVQMLLNIAQTIKMENKNRRPILFVLFSAEEVGLIGSRHFVENLPLPTGAKVVAMVNLDMVGHLHENKLTIMGNTSAHEFPTLISNINRSFSFDLSLAGRGSGSSDHQSFLDIKIPSLFVTTGAHEHYHSPEDTADKINIPGFHRVGAFAYELVRRIDAHEHPPTYDPSSEEEVPPPRRGRGYGSYFGSVPDFKDSGNTGVYLKDVRPGSPAQAAGLQGGDLLMGMGEIGIRNLHEFVFALRFYRPNEKIEVRWKRGDQLMKAVTTLRTREESP